MSGDSAAEKTQVMKKSLLTIKFHRPGIPQKRIQRDHLIWRMNDALANRHLLTLVSAPAGFGKTTCVNVWADQLDLPVIWLSLDPADDDPGQFIAYFIAGLQQVDSRIGKEIEYLLDKEQLPAADAIASVLIRDLFDSGGRIVFVLDDFQVIQDALILKVLEKIILSQLHQLHLVLITREDPLLPLARLRANNLLTEVRSADLRFSTDEISQFYTEVMGLSLAKTDQVILEDRTEGWIAGLQLAGLSLRGQSDPSGFIAGIRGNQRHILSYLTEEVLDRQTEEVREFLLKTSILGKLNGDLCNAVTGRRDSSEMLERLLQANLFLVPLDNEQRWYRYHHLFADLLRTMLKRNFPEAIALLHQRAGQWYAGEGLIAEAVEHALTAEDFHRAVELMEQHAMSIVMQGHVKTVERWFQSIPIEWHQKSPRASIALAGMYLLNGNYHLVEHYLKQSEQITRPDEQTQWPDLQEIDTLRPMWFAIKSNLLNVQGNASESIKIAEQALQEARPDDHYSQGAAYLGLGGAYRLLDNYPRLVDSYQKAIYHSRIAGKALPEMLSANALTQMAIRHGELQFAEEVASQVVERIRISGESLPPVAGSIYGALGMVFYEWNRLDRARDCYQQGLELSWLGGHNAGVVYARILLSRLNMAEGDLPAAAVEIQKAAERIPLGIPIWLNSEYLAQQVRVDLSNKNLGSVRAVLDGLKIDWGDSITPQLEPCYLSYLRWMLFEALQEHRVDELPWGVQLAGRLIDAAQKGSRVSTLLPALLLRAQMHMILGERSAALEDAACAVDRAAPGGFIRTFLDEGPQIIPLLRSSIARIQSRDYGKHLLDCFSSTGVDAGSTPAAQPFPLNPSGVIANQTSLLEPLSERELEVLRLIAQGLKYEEIAEKLVISVNTVRFYIKSIYSKLQVNSRSQAVAAAQQIGLL